MWNSNNALTPDPDREPNNLVSQPWQWPVLHTGLRMASWSDEKVCTVIRALTLIHLPGQVLFDGTPVDLVGI